MPWLVPSVRSWWWSCISASQCLTRATWWPFWPP